MRGTQKSILVLIWVILIFVSCAERSKKDVSETTKTASLVALEGPIPTSAEHLTGRKGAPQTLAGLNRKLGINVKEFATDIYYRLLPEEIKYMEVAVQDPQTFAFSTAIVIVEDLVPGFTQPEMIPDKMGIITVDDRDSVGLAHNQLDNQGGKTILKQIKKRSRMPSRPTTGSGNLTGGNDRIIAYDLDEYQIYLHGGDIVARKYNTGIKRGLPTEDHRHDLDNLKGFRMAKGQDNNYQIVLELKDISK